MMDNPNAGFKKAYLIYVSIFMTLIIGAFVFLWVTLSNYQKEQENEGGDAGSGIEVIGEEDSYAFSDDNEEELAAQRAFKDYVSKLSTDSYVNHYFEGHPERLDSYETVSDFITDKIINADTSLYKARDFDISAPKYVIMSDSETLAEFTLKGSGSDWSIDRAEVMIGGTEILHVKAPYGLGLTINGHEADIVSLPYEEISSEYVQYAEDMVNPVAFSYYTIENMISSEADVALENGYLACDNVLYEIAQEGSENKQKAEDFVSALLHYSAMGKENTEGNQSAALSYVVGNSHAAKVIRETGSGMEWVTPQYSLTYTVSASDPLRLADNCYFIDVSYELNDSENAGSGGVYRIYFLDMGDGYKIMDFAGV